jgi:replicative DNA helicase
MSTSGRKLLSSLITAQDVNSYLKLGLEAHLFKEGEAELFTFVEKHLQKYGKLPHPETIGKAPGMADALVETHEAPKFYLQEVNQRYLHNLLKAGVQEITSLLTEKNADEALTVFTRITMDSYKKKNHRHVMDFRDATDIVYSAYVAQKSHGSLISMPFGWPTPDEMSGGARAGDFITIVGRPMMGKTFMMLYTAHQAWAKSNRKPLFVSMEMTSEAITQRLAAMDTKTKLTGLMKAELSTKAFNSMMGKLTELKQMNKPLWVLDNKVVKDTADLKVQCEILQPDSVWIDAGYLLKNRTRGIGKWEKQSEDAEFIKQEIAGDLEIPSIVSYQLSKESAKNKKKGKGHQDGMEDVTGSDAMAQLSTVMFGLFQSETDIEALNTRIVKMLKGRNGESGEFKINWDFSSKMDFSEVIPPKSNQEAPMDHLG